MSKLDVYRQVHSIIRRSLPATLPQWVWIKSIFSTSTPNIKLSSNRHKFIEGSFVKDCYISHGIQNKRYYTIKVKLYWATCCIVGVVHNIKRIFYRMVHNLPLFIQLIK